MIPVTPSPPPPHFESRVRRPGDAWLAKNPDAAASRFPDHWNKVRNEVGRAFAHRCAYLGHWIPSGQVDHFVPKDRDRSQTYVWENYRWAEPRVNNRKRTAAFLDPFTVQPGWIGIDPVTMTYFITDVLPPAHRDTAEATLQVLNDSELVEARLEWLAACELPDGGRYMFPDAHFPLLAAALAAAGLFGAPSP